MKKICIVFLVLLAFTGIASASSTIQQAQVAINPQDIIDWIYNNLIVPVENFISFLYDQIIRVARLPFDIIYNVLSSFGQAVFSVFDSIREAIQRAFSVMFGGG